MIHKGICNHSCAPVVNHSYAPACNHSYTMDGLAERIAKIRKEAGDTLSQAAKHVGISRQAYTKWEVGDTADMRFANIMKLSVSTTRRLEVQTLRNPPGPAVATPIQHPPIGGIFFAR